jgi:hypothetical protein
MTIEFDYEVKEPDPESTNPSRRKQSVVRATVANSEDPAGSTGYGLGPGHNVISLTRMETLPEYKGKGCGRGMIKALRAHYPDCIVIDGGSTNSDEGNAFLAAMRKEGLVDADPDGELLASWLKSLPVSERVLAEAYAEWDGFKWHDRRPAAKGE